MRDENGFKCHVASESHVRQMQLIGEDPRKAINDFSSQFLRDFLLLLRTGHGEKKVNVNHFYQEYISNKQHIHMNATKWASLTEFAKYLGREGICRVDEDEKNEGKTGASGLTISWIDNSPEALRRQEALRKKERQDRGDEEREKKMIEAQIRRAKRDGMDEDVETDHENGSEPQPEGDGIKRKDGEKIVLNFGTRKHSPEIEKPPTPPVSHKDDTPSDKDKDSASISISPLQQTDVVDSLKPKSSQTSDQPSLETRTKQPLKLTAFGVSSGKPKNVFATASKKNALSVTKKPTSLAASRPTTEAERIMKEEIERKRQRELKSSGANSHVFKKQRLS